MTGIDYSFARPEPSAITQAGYQFVCRYLASAAGKAITPSEAQSLQAAGLSLVLVFEDYASQALNGQAQGVADAKEALSQANALGFPADRPIYFAVDFDATPAQQAAIDAYLQGAASVIGADRVGVYGGYWVVKRCLDNGTAKWAWQTVAWSGGNIDPRIHIYQNGQSAFGGGADVDEAKQSDYGQWPKGDIMNQDDLTVLHELALFAPPGPLYLQAFDGHPFMEAANSLRADPPYNNPDRHALDVKLADYDNMKSQLDAANAEIADLKNQLANQPQPAPAPAPAPSPAPAPKPTPKPSPAPVPSKLPNWLVAILKALHLR